MKNRFCVDIRRICCDVFYFLIRVTKKIYTYNFYSYDRSEFFVAAIMNTIFLIFITSNIIYIILSRNDFIYIDDNQIKEEESIQKKALYFIAFETHLFLEILCPIYYRGLTFKTSLNMTFIYLIYSNGACIDFCSFSIKFYCNSFDSKRWILRSSSKEIISYDICNDIYILILKSI